MRLVIAVGPEGGWSDQEVETLVSQHGFKVIDCGNRILRTDVAVTSLMALANAWVLNDVLTAAPASRE
jgi:16S rRNA (uracil1498-N3)-methyltransferase